MVWEQALVDAGNSYAALQPAIRDELDREIAEIMLLKQQLVELVTAAGSGEICRTCGGECCRFGKYHVSVLDILAYLKRGERTVVPDFGTAPFCPYSDVSGCTMAPHYRPMTCVVFNCQLVEEQLSSAQRDDFRLHEQELREAIARAGRITGKRLDRALLLSCDRNV
jgi:Fe-S-cluster containining protein